MFLHRSTDPGPVLSCDVPEIATAGELRGWVETMSVPRHFHRESNANRSTALWIEGLLKGWGYEVHFYGETRNVVATRPGLRGSAVLVGAHYDSVPHCPGADDNASAVAAMLAVARAFAAKKDVVFVAFNREEDGLLGSTEFANETLQTMPWEISAAHILEMVGFASSEAGSQRVPDGLPITLPSAGDFIALLANGESAAMLAQIIAIARGAMASQPVVGLEIRIGLEKFLPVLQRSDHASFWEKHIPAVMWTDTSEFRNPHYHLRSDEPETLNYEFLRNVARLVAASVIAAQPR